MKRPDSMRYIIPLLCASAALARPALAEVPVVVTDIPPVHGLVSAVMEGVAEPVLLLEKARVAGGMQWIASTVKDRERERLWRAEWTDMGMEYLKQIAGWKMTKMEETDA